MDTTKWRPTPSSGENTMDGGDWRTTLHPDSRQRIVNKIMDTLKRHLPYSGQEGLNECRKIAVRIEEKIFTAANSQSDYLRRISLKMLTMETKSQNMPNTGNTSKPPDPGSQGMQNQVRSQGQSIPVPLHSNQSQERQQLLPQSVPNNSGDWRTTLQPDSRQRIVNKIMDTLKRHLPFSGQEGLNELRKIAVRFEEKIFTAASSQSDYLRRISLKMLTMETKSQNMPNTGNTSKPPDPGSHGMQNQVHSQGQSIPVPLHSNQSQARQQLLPKSVPNNSGDWRTTVQPDSRQRIVNKIMDTLMRHLPFSGQEGLNELRKIAVRFEEKIFTAASSQSDYLRRISLKMLTMETKSQNMPNTGNTSKPTEPGSLGKQNQVHSRGQSIPVPLQSSQSVLRQQQQLQQITSSSIHQQQTPMTMQSKMSQQQQPHMMAQQTNAANIQQSQLIGQQNTIADMQQQRMLGQSSYLANMQQQLLQQQQLMAQQNNLSNIHQQQLGSQSNILGLQQQQQQLIGTQSGNSSMQTSQQSLHMLSQPQVPLQQTHQTASNLLPSQEQASHQPQRPQLQLMSQMQSQSAQLQQQLGLQQQINQVQQNMQQRLHALGQTSNSLLQSQNLIDQQKQLYQSQRAVLETSSTSLDSTAQTGQANEGDWQGEVYQKIKAMKETYLPELNEMHQKIAAKLLQHDSLPQQPKPEQLDKLKIFKTMLERILHFLTVSKANIVPAYKEKLSSYEKQIINFINANRPRKPISAMQQGQLPPPHTHSMQSHDNEMNPQLQSINLQGSMPTMRPNNMTSMQHNSLSSFAPANFENPAYDAYISQQRATYEEAGSECAAPDTARNGMPTVSPPSLLPGFEKAGDTNGNALTTDFSKPDIKEQTHDSVVNTAKPNSLRSIVVTMADEASAAVGEELAAKRKQGPHARTFFIQTGMTVAEKMKCYLGALAMFVLIIYFIFDLYCQY